MAYVELSLEKLEEIAFQVKMKHLPVDPFIPPSDPILGAAADLYDSVVVGIKLVALEGQEALAAAKEAVVRKWEEKRSILRDKAEQVLTRFQDMVADLSRQIMEAIASALPPSLGAAKEFALESVTYKTTIAISPSVGLAAEGVLRLAASSGLEIQATYKISPAPSFATPPILPA